MAGARGKRHRMPSGCRISSRSSAAQAVLSLPWDPKRNVEDRGTGPNHAGCARRGRVSGRDHSCLYLIARRKVMLLGSVVDVRRRRAENCPGMAEIGCCLFSNYTVENRVRSALKKALSCRSRAKRLRSQSRMPSGASGLRRLAVVFDRSLPDLPVHQALQNKGSRGEHQKDRRERQAQRTQKKDHPNCQRPKGGNRR